MVSIPVLRRYNTFESIIQNLKIHLGLFLRRYMRISWIKKLIMYNIINFFVPSKQIQKQIDFSMREIKIRETPLIMEKSSRWNNTLY